MITFGYLKSRHFNRYDVWTEGNTLFMDLGNWHFTITIGGL